jgi:hypothetical protein
MAIPKLRFGDVRPIEFLSLRRPPRRRAMAVKRIVANMAVDQFESVKAFCCDILQMKVVMDFGWIVTLASDTPTAQLRA